MTRDIEMKVAAVILAGGRGRRMGGRRKADLPLGGRALLAWVIERLAPQTDCLLLSVAIEDPGWRRWGVPVLCDAAAEPHMLGPAAGIVRALDWLAEQDASYRGIVSAPCDTPFLPPDLVAALTEPKRGADRAAVARSGGRDHPTVGFWPLAARAAMHSELSQPGGRRLGRLAAKLGAVTVDFSTDPVDPFFNVNRPDELAAAEAILNEGGRDAGLYRRGDGMGWA